ncbi:MAG: AAA family ATPase [Bacteroidetes bacterium]|nr:AAA family ATPase [Bacteroidota bacterium]
MLIVITGRPASGKSTLAVLLSERLNLPLLSRDRLKEGYLITHPQPGAQTDLHIYETFFKTIDLFLSNGISLIAEAAFQHKLWAPKLTPLLTKTDVKIVICETPPSLSKSRFETRRLNNPSRKTFHGENSSGAADTLIENYENLHLDAPILHVDTSNQYKPTLEEIIAFLKNKFA